MPSPPSLVPLSLQAYPHQALWALAAVSKSGVAARRAAASAIINSAKKNMDQSMFGERLMDRLPSRHGMA